MPSIPHCSATDNKHKMPKKAQRSAAQKTLEIGKWGLFNVAWPAAVAGVVVQQVLRKRKQRKAAQPPADKQQQQQPKEEQVQHSKKDKPKPRRDYRVALDPQAVEDAKRRAQVCI